MFSIAWSQQRNIPSQEYQEVSFPLPHDLCARQRASKQASGTPSKMSL